MNYIVSKSNHSRFFSNPNFTIIDILQCGHNETDELTAWLTVCVDQYIIVLDHVLDHVLYWFVF